MNDKEMAEVSPGEVPRQVADLEHACERLTSVVKVLEKHCASVISSTLKSDQNAEGIPMATLCPLAASLCTCVRRIGTAREGIESLMERMEL